MIRSCRDNANRDTIAVMALLHHLDRTEFILRTHNLPLLPRDGGSHAGGYR